MNNYRHLRLASVIAAIVSFAAAPLMAQTAYSVNVGGGSFLVGPCSGNTNTGTFLSGSAPVAANAHCGPAGGTIDASGFANPGKLGANLALSEGNGGPGSSTVSFLTHVVFSSIDPNASQAPIAIALNAVVGGQIYAGPSSSNGAWSTILSLGSNNFSFSHSINAGDPTLYPNGANSLTFTNGGETGTVSAGTATDTISGTLTTPTLAPVGLGTPIFIKIELSISGFGNPGSFGGNMVLTCPVGADLFTLPPGYTANDPDIHLVNNRCVPPVLYSWGSNGSGQLGNGTTADSSTPVQVVGPGGIGTMQDVIAVSGGRSHSLALTDTGAVYAWGDNSVGQLGIGSATLSSPTPVQVSLPGGRAIAVAAGKNHSLALMDDLTVYSWGGNLNGQVGDGGVGPNIFTPVKVQGPSGSIPLAGISAIAAGNQFSVALVQDGTVYTWGANLRGQLGNGSTSDHVSLPAQVVGLGGSGILNVATGISASATSDHVLALTNGQTVYAWGEDLSGELGIGTTGTFSPFPVQVKDMAGTGLLRNISAVADGGQHSLALSIPFDTIYAWGDNTQNELGNNSNIGQSIPGQVLAPGGIGFHPGIAAIQGGGAHGLASTTVGGLYAWGAATHGQLGDGNISAGSGATPVQVLGLGGTGLLQYVSTFAAGNLHSLAVAARPTPAAPPDLTVTKTHVGDFTQGQQAATYTITVTNTGTGPTAGTVTVSESLPAGLASNSVGVLMAGTGWSCDTIAASCTRGDALAAGASYPAITVTINVPSNAPASATNTATVSGGGEVNTANNTASDPTTIIPLPVVHPDLTITKTHMGNFTQGQGGVTYTITVSNVGNAPAFGGSLNGPPPITVVDTFPVGLIGNAGAAAGQGWNCDLNSVCSRSDALAPGASYPPITMTVSVAANAPASLTNVATVSGGGDINTANNTASDPTTILPAGHPDLAITKTHVGNFTQGQGGVTYTITVSNVGNAPAFGGSLNGPPPITVVDTFPVGLIGNAGAAAGQGWNCDLNSVCSRSDALAPGASYPPITMTVSVAANAPASLTNVATVSGGGDINTANNTASDPTTILPAGHPDLAITKTHVGNFTQGQGGVTYTITVSNVGNAPAFGGSLNGPPPITVVDTFPVGLIGNAGAAAGQGWNCDLNSVCSRSDALAPGASYPPITMTVSVAANAPASLTNVATVSGGGDINTANNTASDPTTILPAGHPDLAITKTHVGNFTQGQGGVTYTITVSNVGNAPAFGGSLNGPPPITVVDTFPVGLIGNAGAAAGQGWNCDLNSVCSRSDALAPGASYPPITMTVSVAANAPASLTNVATVSGGGDINTANNTASDPTTILPAPKPDLTITKTHNGNFTAGLAGTYTITVTNAGTGPTTGTVTVQDLLPSGLTAIAMAGAGWNCTSANTTCTRNNSLTSGGVYPPITVAVLIASNAPASLTNSATVAGGGEVNTANDTVNDPTSIVLVPDLSIAKTHVGNLSRGRKGIYDIEVRNVGGASTTGTVTVVDLLPAGLTAVELFGTGWNCNLTTSTCTRNDALPPGARYPAITFAVNVAANAPSPLRNRAAVVTVGDTNPLNNLATDTADLP